MCETQLRAGLALVDSAGVVLLACRVGAAGCNIRISGYSEVGIAPGLGTPWRYPGQGIVKRRKALQHLRLWDFLQLLKAA